MDNKIKVPIIVVEGNDINFFKTVEDAEKSVEPIDIKENYYKIFDSEGKLIIPIVEIKKIKYLWILSSEIEVVKLKETVSDEKYHRDLKQSLINFIKVVELKEASEDELESFDLKKLLEISIKFSGFS